MQNENNYTNNDLNNNVNNYLSNVNEEIPSIQNNINIQQPIKKSNGLASSITSALIFFIVFLPYFIGCFYDDYGMLIVIGGGLILPFVITSYIFGRTARKSYKNYTDKKTLFRKILNIINIISSILMIPYLVFFVGAVLGIYASTLEPTLLIALVCIIIIIAIYIYIKQKKKKGV